MVPECGREARSQMKTVIVGAVAGGMSAATRLRRLDPAAEILVFERGEHVSYANCGLPYHVGGVITDRQALLLQTPDRLHARFDLDVRVRSEVTAIDPLRRLVQVRRSAAGSTRKAMTGSSSAPARRRSSRTCSTADTEPETQAPATPR